MNLLEKLAKQYSSNDEEIKRRLERLKKIDIDGGDRNGQPQQTIRDLIRQAMINLIMPDKKTPETDEFDGD